jgi:hypothetical protein
VSVPAVGAASVSTVIMRLRLLTGSAVVPSALVVLTAVAGPADAAAGVSEPTKQAADSVALLAGGMVVAASAAFAGTGMVRRRKFRR